MCIPYQVHGSWFEYESVCLSPAFLLNLTQHMFTTGTVGNWVYCPQWVSWVFEACELFMSCTLRLECSEYMEYIRKSSHSTARDITWLSAGMCHLCKCRLEKIEIWYTSLRAGKKKNRIPVTSIRYHVATLPPYLSGAPLCLYHIRHLSKPHTIILINYEMTHFLHTLYFPIC